MEYMKKIAVLSIALFCLPVFLSFGQDTYTYNSEHYAVHTGISEEFAQETAKFLEGFFDLYTGYLHFDPESLDGMMKVRIFKDKGSYDAYLKNIIKNSRSSFVYLQYPDPKKSELIGYRADPEDSFQKKLIHHGFVQYIKSFIPNPPLWLQKGFAVYFENCGYDSETGEVTFRPNYSWVETLRQKIDQDPSLSNPDLFIPVQNLLYIDQDSAVVKLESFYAQSWGLIDFLIHSETKNYNRLLWDAISSLEASASMTDNERKVVSNSFEWAAKDQLVSDFVAYINNLQTFPDLVQSGIDAFSTGEMDTAEKDFQQALNLRQDHYVPYYYLGLISYNRGEYSMAEFYYLSAVKNNGHADLIYYALGVNAYADNRLDDSSFYLSQSVEAGGSYSSLSSDLIEEIEVNDEAESDSM